MRGKYAYVESNPENLLDPMGLWFLRQHNDITISAFNSLMKKNKSCRCKYTSSNIVDIRQGLEVGCINPDTLSSSYGGRRTGRKEFDRSHYGENLFWHAMRYQENSAQELRDKVSERIGSYMIFGRNRKRDFYLKGLTIGEGLHTFEDTFNEAHVIRSGNLISWFQEYEYQDKVKHFMSDINVFQPGYIQSINHVYNLLDMVLCRESSDQEIINYVDSMMQLTPDAKYTGTHEKFAKTYGEHNYYEPYDGTIFYDQGGMLLN